MRALAIFGPTAVGKTGVAIEVADRLRERGEDPVAISCDSIQVYRGLEILSGAAGRPTSRRAWSTGCSESPASMRSSQPAGSRSSRMPRSIALLAEGRRPIVVGGTGLYMRAALSELELRPPVPSAVRAAVEADLDRRGAGGATRRALAGARIAACTRTTASGSCA